LLRALGAALAGLSLVFAGCSGGQPQQNEDGLTELRVGTIPTVDAAALYLGVEQGIFERHGLSVEVHVADGGAAIVPAVVAGDDQIGYSNVISSAVAVDNGIPITLIQDCCAAAGSPEQDTSRILVKPDGRIKTPADLAGADIAVNTLQNIGEVTIKMALRNEGVPIDDIKFTQLPFADMNDALERGDVDAIWQVSPNVQTALDRGFEPIMSPFTQADPDGVLGHWLTSQQFAQQNPDTVRAFVDAMAEANGYAEEHPDEVRATIVKNLKFDEATLAKSTLPAFPGKGVEADDVKQFVNAAIEFGIVAEEPDYGSYIWSGDR